MFLIFYGSYYLEYLPCVVRNSTLFPTIMSYKFDNKHILYHTTVAQLKLAWKEGDNQKILKTFVLIYNFSKIVHHFLAKYPSSLNYSSLLVTKNLCLFNPPTHPTSTVFNWVFDFNAQTLHSIFTIQIFPF